MMRKIWVPVLVVSLLVLIYISGPEPGTPQFSKTVPNVPISIPELEQYVKDKEDSLPVKPGNEATIVWYDSLAKSKTEYAIVYLHGFSASHEEGSPVHRTIAERFGMNLYLSRLQAHGLDEENPLLNFTPEGVWESAKEALEIGHGLGKNVILMSTSTGGTLSLMLAAEYDNIAALICYSPNIAIKDNMAFMLNNPWGLQIARAVIGSDFRRIHKGPDYARYWNNAYRIESLVALQVLLEESMTKQTFAKITEPIYLAYYYKNEKEQDPVVRVSAMKRMFEELDTPIELKRAEAFPEAGNHVLASWVQSNDVVGVTEGTTRFMEEVLGLHQVDSVRNEQAQESHLNRYDPSDP